MTPTLHLIFKTHLDLGFTGYAADVRRQYHDYFIPMALDTGEHFLRENPDRPQFVWTTGSWLVWDHLQTQSADKVRRLERGIENGIIRWHGLPFTTHTELMSPALVREALSISQELDARFGTRTIAAKMTDVPGHTIGLVPLLAQAGIEFLHIGVNSASTPPSVPPVFRWRAPDGSEVVVMYQSDYGSTLVPDGMQDGIAFAHTMDNMGPQNVGHVVDSFYQLSQDNPHMDLRASTLDAFAATLRPHRDGLPVIEAEIADSWIHGIGTAPKRVSRYLAARRAFDGFAAEGLTPERRAFARKLLEVPEHTWGVDIKVYLRDEKAWDRPAFDAARLTDKRFAIAEGAWAEQDAIIDQALSLLDATDRAHIHEAPAAPIATPDGNPIDGEKAYQLGDWQLRFDPQSGALHSSSRGGKSLTAGENDGLFRFAYESYDDKDIEAYKQSYLTAWYRWGVQDHGKPGLDLAKSANSTHVTTANARLSHTPGSISIIAKCPPEAFETLGAPRDVRTTYQLAPDGSLSITVELRDKPANRMPEAGFITFAPEAEPNAWRMEKLGQSIDPLGVVEGGSRQLHAVDAISGRTPQQVSFRLETLDAPLFVPGNQPFLPFVRTQPNMSAGSRFNIFNNKWGTNFSMWTSGTLQYRFRLDLSGA
jgi:hypothetical protein